MAMPDNLKRTVWCRAAYFKKIATSFSFSRAKNIVKNFKDDDNPKFSFILIYS
jgi:hypothetical protein